MFSFCLSKTFSPSEWLDDAPKWGAFLLLVFAGITSQVGLSSYLLGALLLPLAEASARYRLGLQPGTGGARFGIGLLIVAHSYFLSRLQYLSAPSFGLLHVSAAPGLFRFLATLQYVTLAALSLLGSLLYLHARIQRAIAEAPSTSEEQ